MSLSYNDIKNDMTIKKADRLGICAGLGASVVPIGITLCMWFVLPFPTWARVMIAIFGLGIAIVLFVLLSNRVSRVLVLMRPKCPSCGRRLRRVTEWGFSDSAAVGGYAVRQNIPVDYDICRCGYEKAI